MAGEGLMFLSQLAGGLPGGYQQWRRANQDYRMNELKMKEIMDELAQLKKIRKQQFEGQRTAAHLLSAGNTKVDLPLLDQDPREVGFAASPGGPQQPMGPSLITDSGIRGGGGSLQMEQPPPLLQRPEITTSGATPAETLTGVYAQGQTLPPDVQSGLLNMMGQETKMATARKRDELGWAKLRANIDRWGKDRMFKAQKQVDYLNTLDRKFGIQEFQFDQKMKRRDRYLTYLENKLDSMNMNNYYVDYNGNQVPAKYAISLLRAGYMGQAIRWKEGQYTDDQAYALGLDQGWMALDTIFADLMGQLGVPFPQFNVVGGKNVPAPRAKPKPKPTATPGENPDIQSPHRNKKGTGWVF